MSRVDKDVARPEAELVDGAFTLATKQRARVEADHLKNLPVVTLVISKDRPKSCRSTISAGDQLKPQ